MPKLRSATTTHGRNMAGARALWRATGMTDQDFGKPIIAVVNSFTQFVPGHVHLRDLGPAGRPRDRGRRRPPRSSTPSPWMTASPWATAACSIQPAEPRADRRLGRIHGQRPLRRRHGLHLQLRQDHPGMLMAALR